MRELIIFNFTMNADHPVLSHQLDTALLLSSHFDFTTVISADARDVSPRVDFKVISTNWTTGNRLGNALRLLFLALPILWKKRKTAVVFSHMTDFQSALLGPVTKMLKIRHYLWYAHKTNSIYLQFANVFIDGIITSTSGSCPIRSPKVHEIGQAVDEKFFLFNPPDNNSHLVKALHFGRLDPSKRIDSIISSISNLIEIFPDLSFTQIGSPSTNEAQKSANRLFEEWGSAISAGWLKFEPSVARGELPGIIPNYDVFFHAYLGSLDKTLIEATLCGIPVVSLNSEYLSEFGSWGEIENMTLESEYTRIVRMNQELYVEELRRRYRICVDRHSRARWIGSLVEILIDSKRTSSGRDS